MSGWGVPLHSKWRWNISEGFAIEVVSDSPFETRRAEEAPDRGHVQELYPRGQMMLERLLLQSFVRKRGDPMKNDRSNVEWEIQQFM